MKNANPKISVIMPSLNVREYIKECVDSVLNQTLTDIEIICVDAGSDDGTLDILKEYEEIDSRLKVIISNKRSYGHQMNLGLKQAKGEYISIVETDDFIARDMYNNLYNLSQNGTIDIIKGTFYHLYDYDKYTYELTQDWSKKELNNVKEPFDIFDQERFLDGHPSIWAGIYRKKLIDDYDIKFIEEPGGGWVDNGFFYETACAANTIIYRPEPYYYYREENPDSSSNNLGDFTIPIRRMIENLEILNKYNCISENILHMAYIRVFAYLNNIYRREGYENHMPELEPYINRMMSMLDEDIVNEKLNKDMQNEYYKYVNKGNIKKQNKINEKGSSKFSDGDIKSNNNVLYNKEKKFYENQIRLIQEKNNQLVKENTVLSKNNNDLLSKNKKLNENLIDVEKQLINEKSQLKNMQLKYNSILNDNNKLNLDNNQLNTEIKSIKSSKAFKLGTALAAPIRKIKSLRHDYNKKNSLKNKPLKVLFVPSDNNRTSGAFLSMANLVNNLKIKYNIEEYVIIPNKGNGDAILEAMGINYKLVESRDWVIPLSLEKNDAFRKDVANKKNINNAAIDEIRRIIRENKIDILHINTTYSYVGAKAALAENIPFVWHLREFLEEDQSNTLWDRDEGNKLINQANRIIAISNSIYKKYENIFDKQRLVKIYNGIDANKFYKKDRNILDDKPVKFIMVGGFEYYKGQIEFAKACAKLYKQGFHDFEISFVGTGKGEVKDKVDKILHDAGLKDVTYWGYKKNVEDFYDKSDISFTCAKSEAFGRTTVEAMLSGNLLIGADTAGTKELIDDKKTGLLYKHGNPDDLCEKMLYAINNKRKSKKMADKGRKYMFNNMTAEINADKIFKLYNEVLSENK